MSPFRLVYFCWCVCFFVFFFTMTDILNNRLSIKTWRPVPCNSAQSFMKMNQSTRVRFLRWPGSPSPRLCWLPSLFSLRTEQSEPPLWPAPPACRTEGCSSRPASPTTFKPGTRNRTAWDMGGVMHQRRNRQQHSRRRSFRIKSLRDKSKTLPTVPAG